MNKKHLFESIMISALLVAMLSSLVSAGYPGPDTDTDTDYGSYNSYARAYVSASYGSPSYYTSESFTSSRNPGQAQNDGSMYYCNFIDQVYIQGYETSNSHTSSSGIDCTLVAAYTVADFKYGVQEWTCEALATRQIY